MSKLPYYEKPRNDFEKLFNYQHDWLINKSKSAEVNFWILSRIVIKRIVIGIYKTRGITKDSDTIEEKTSVAQEYILRRYYRQSGYYIHSSMGNALRNGAIHAIDYKTKADRLIIKILKDNPIQILQAFIYDMQT